MRDQATRRTVLLALAAFAAGCGGGGDGTGPGGTALLTLHSPTVTIAAGSDSTLCSFIHLPNTGEDLVNGWQVTVPSGVASAALIFTATDAQPVGTVTNNNCDPLGSGATVGALIIEARSSGTLALPGDDGAGKQVAAVIPAHQSAILRVRYVNAGSDPISPQVTFTGLTLRPSTPFTRADPFVTYTDNISLAPDASGTFTDSCATPAGAKFFRATVFSHIYATSFSIRDGATTVFSGTDPANPGATTALNSPFLTFASGRITTSCSFNNTSGHVLQTGSSFTSNENCIAATWYFPSTGAKFCFDGNVIDLPAVPRRPVND